MTAGYILLMVLWNQATGLSLTVSEIFNGEYDAMVDVTLNDLQTKVTVIYFIRFGNNRFLTYDFL